MKKKSRLLLLILLPFIFVACNQETPSPYPPLSLNTLSPMPDGGRASAVAFVLNNKAYITLGRNATSSDSLKDCWEFDPQTSLWTKKMIFPGQARVKGVAATVLGKAYIGLGFARNKGAYSGGNLQDWWCYDAAAGKWERKADLPSLCSNACFCFVLNNEIYIGAGFDGGAFRKECWKYNVSANSWTRLNNLPGAGRAGSVACAGLNHVYWGTGYDTTNKIDWWEYNQDNDKWTQKENIPDDGRENGVAFAVGNRYFVSSGRRFGGDLTGGHVKDDIREFDAEKNCWYNRGALPKARENAICFVINGKAYIGQGEDDNGIINDLACFEP